MPDARLSGCRWDHHRCLADGLLPGIPIISHISRSTLLAGGVFIVALLKATGVLMEPLVRVSEVDQAITDVKAAYQDALKAPNRLLTPAVPSVCLPAPAAS